MGWKILLPQDIMPAGREYLEKNGHEIIMGKGMDEATICQDIKGIDAMIVRQAKITGKIIEASDRLKVIVRHGVGYDAVDIDACKARGIAFLYCPNANSVSVAETAIFNMLYCSRNFNLVHKRFIDDYFFAKLKTPKIELDGKVLGIIGLGKIGTLVALKCQAAFNMSVIAWDPYKDPKTFPEGVSCISDKDRIFRESDFISVHIPLTDETKEFIGKREFALMKPTAFFINTSRGMVVNEKDLYEACKNGIIAGAGLDVLQKEPVEKENPILYLDNVVVSPHIGAATQEASSRASLHAAMGIQEIYEGKKPTWPVPGFQ
jgi:D-3-phosphoglycerate dehydrogenase